MFLTIDDGNQGMIAKYQFAFKNNTVYSFNNVQKLTTPIFWGNQVKVTEPTIDKLGNMEITFIDPNNTNRSSWTLKMNAKRVMSYTI